MSFGFMGKLLRVDLSKGIVAAEEIPEQWKRLYLGGAGLASKYLFDEVPPDTDPLGPTNKLIFMTGPLNVINFSRLVCNSSKSFFFFYDYVDIHVQA